jgi:hypothetical protein
LVKLDFGQKPGGKVNSQLGFESDEESGENKCSSSQETSSALLNKIDPARL